MLIGPQFRNHKQQDTANLLGKLCVKLVEVVDEGMNHILEDQSIIDVRVNAPCALITLPGTKFISGTQR